MLWIVTLRFTCTRLSQRFLTSPRAWSDVAIHSPSADGNIVNGTDCPFPPFLRHDTEGDLSSSWHGDHLLNARRVFTAWTLHYIRTVWITVTTVKSTWLMSTRTSLPPPDLTDVDIAIVFQILDAELSSVILYSLLSGAYVYLSEFKSLILTGRRCIHRYCCYNARECLWGTHVYCAIRADVNGTDMNKSQPIRRAMALIVVLLHTVTIFNFASCWAYVDSMFIDNGWNFWTVHLAYTSPSVVVEVGMSATGAVCTILADSTMVRALPSWISASAYAYLGCRSGVVGWSGDADGYPFCFLSFFSLPQSVRSPGSSNLKT